MTAAVDTEIRLLTDFLKLATEETVSERVFPTCLLKDTVVDSEVDRGLITDLTVVTLPVQMSETLFETLFTTTTVPVAVTVTLLLMARLRVIAADESGWTVLPTVFRIVAVDETVGKRRFPTELTSVVVEVCRIDVAFVTDLTTLAEVVVTAENGFTVCRITLVADVATTAIALLTDFLNVTAVLATTEIVWEKRVAPEEPLIGLEAIGPSPKDISFP